MAYQTHMQGNPGQHFFVTDATGTVVYRSRHWRRIWRWLRMHGASR